MLSSGYSFFTQPPAYEDGTDSVFRKVGTQNSFIWFSESDIVV